MCLKIRKFAKRTAVFLLALLVACSVVLPDYERVEAVPLAPEIAVTFYDIIYSLFVSVGITCLPVYSDGEQKTLGRELWDELCDTFDLWLVANCGTSDPKEISEQFRRIPWTIHDEVISITDELWDYFHRYANDVVASEGLEGLESVLKTCPVSEAYPYPVVCNYRIKEIARYNYRFSKFVGAYDNADVLLFTFHYFESSREYYYSALVCPTQFTVSGISGERLSRKYGCYYYVNTGSSMGLSDVPIYSIQFVSTERHIIEGMSLEQYLSALAAGTIAWPEELAASSDVAVSPTDVSLEKDNDSVAYAPSISIISTDVASDVVDVLNPPWEDTDEKEEDKDQPLVIPIPGEGTLTVDPAAELSNDNIQNYFNGNYGDITTLFPFCIPFDLIRMVRGMEAAKSLPVFHFEHRFEAINYDFVVDVDLTDYDRYIQIFRDGMKIFWVFALMFLTVRVSGLFI